MKKLISQLKEEDSAVCEEKKEKYILLSMPRSYVNIIMALKTMDEQKLDFVKTRLSGEVVLQKDKI